MRKKKWMDLNIAVDQIEFFSWTVNFPVLGSDAYIRKMNAK
jgi:hypothetical protein